MTESKKNKESETIPIGSVRNSWALLRIAEDAADRAVTRPNQNFFDSIVAVVFSAAFIEAYINELIWEARKNVEKGIVSADNIARLGHFGTWAVDNKVRLLEKYDLIAYTLSGQKWDRKQGPWPKFKLLVDLRNDLLHIHKPEILELMLPGGKKGVRWMKGVKSLKAQGIIPKDAPGGRSSSLVELDAASPQLAKWAIATVEEIKKSILDRLTHILVET